MPGPIKGILCLVQVQKNRVEDRFPHGHNLLKKFDLKGCGSRTASHPEPMEVVVLGNGGGEMVIEYHRHCLPHHLYETYSSVVPSPFRY